MPSKPPALFKNLLPFRYVHDYPVWQETWVRWSLLLGVTPPALTLAGNKNLLSFEGIALGFSIYFALLFGVLIFYLVRPGREGLERTLFIGVFGALLGVACVFGAQLVAPVAEVQRMIFASEWGYRLVGYWLGVGVVEEGAKGAALLILAFGMRAKEQAHAVVYAGVVCGLSFGAAESLHYLREHAHLTHGADDAGALIAGGMVRMITIPLLHALWSGIVGCFVALALEFPKVRLKLLLFGLLLVSGLHGLYDFFAQGMFSFMLAVASLVLFAVYVRTLPSIRLRLREIDTPQ